MITYIIEVMKLGKRIWTIIISLILLLAVLPLQGCADSDRITLESLSGVPKSEIRYAYVNCNPVELEKIYEYYDCNFEEYTESAEDAKVRDTISVYDEKENLLFILEKIGDKGVIRISGVDGCYRMATE